MALIYVALLTSCSFGPIGWLPHMDIPNVTLLIFLRKKLGILLLLSYPCSNFYTIILFWDSGMCYTGASEGEEVQTDRGLIASCPPRAVFATSFYAGWHADLPHEQFLLRVKSRWTTWCSFILVCLRGHVWPDGSEFPHP